MKTCAGWGFAIALVVAGAGCDWREIDKLAEHTPVLSVGAPKDFGPKDDFGRVVVPINAPPDMEGVAAQFVVAGVSGTGLAVVSLDAKGRPKSRNIKSPILDALESYSVPAVAEIADGTPVKLLVGAPVIKNVEGGQVFVASLAEKGDVLRFSSLSELGYGIGLAAANLVGGAAPDYVVLSADKLRVYVDGTTTGMVPEYASTAMCPISLSATRPNPMSQMPINRAVLIGHWVGAGADLQIAVGTPAAGTGKGSVSFFSVSASAVTCLQTLAGTEVQFGQALAAGDFNGDGVSDLAVGAPPGNAYVYLGPLGPSAAGVPVPPDPSSRRFGSALAAMNVDGKGGDELLVSDPQATVKEVAMAGAAYIFSFTTATPAKMSVLADNAPADGAAYGTTVNALSFCSTQPCTAGNRRRLVVVGAGAEVFTYFKLSASDTDPRQP